MIYISHKRIYTYVIMNNNHFPKLALVYPWIKDLWKLSKNSSLMPNVLYAKSYFLGSKTRSAIFASISCKAPSILF